VLSVDFPDGVAILGTYPNPDVLAVVQRTRVGLGLMVFDPPYGHIVPEKWDRPAGPASAFCDQLLAWVEIAEALSIPGGALYLWGGIGKPGYRPFYQFAGRVETETAWTLANHITWSKKRAYGLAWNYLFTREELLYLVLGDPKKPACFHVPLLETKRGYAGYSEKYPAKSEYLRRTNVWSDVTEVLRGKVHPCQKPARLTEILLQVHTEPGDWVFDPFAGSGSTALAARALGRKFIVVEEDPETFQALVTRLRA
jgi:DNA modification methylase